MSMKSEHPTDKKPAIVITRFPYESAWGGEESHTMTLARFFRDQGYEVIFFGSCLTLLQKFSEEGFTTRSVWGSKMIVTPFELLKSFLLAPFIKWNLKKHFDDVLNTYEVKALYCLSLNEKLFLTPAAVAKSIPVTWVEHQFIRGWLLKSPWKNLYQKNAQQVQIIPISKVNEKTLLNALRIPEKNLKWITNGVDVKKLEGFKRQTQKDLVVCANRFIPKKGIITFLHAMKNVLKNKPEIDVKIIGKGEQEEEIKKYVTEHFERGAVEITYFLKKENLYKLLSKADVFVMPSEDNSETFSLVTAEAMALGCKCVVTNCSGIADFLKDGNDALLCPPKNPDQLSEKILQALSSSDDMRTKAQETCQRNFNLQDMLELFQSVILRKS